MNNKDRLVILKIHVDSIQALLLSIPSDGCSEVANYGMVEIEERLQQMECLLPE